jgi:hypothetical protein
MKILKDGFLLRTLENNKIKMPFFYELLQRMTAALQVIKHVLIVLSYNMGLII